MIIETPLTCEDCGQDADRNCARCEKLICDDCDKGTFSDEESLCSECKDLKLFSEREYCESL